MKDSELRKQLRLRDRLLHLEELDRDVAQLYDWALRHATDEDVRHAFERFQAEHRQHETELIAVIQRIGWSTPDVSLGLKGHLADWMISLRSATGTGGALRGMRTAERYCNKKYGEAFEWQGDAPELAALLHRFAEDE